VRAGVEAVEKSVRKARHASGKRVLGSKRVRSLSWRAAPTSVESRGQLRPRFAGGGPARIAALLEYRQFLVDYATARRRWLERLPVIFPPGTYWLARRAAVAVASASAPPLA